MDRDLQKELAAHQKRVEAAGIPDCPRQTILSCLKQMPPLYLELMRTYESKYVDQIVRLVTVIRRALTNNGALKVGEAIATRITAMHSRRGFPGLGLKPAIVAPTKRRKPRVK